MYSRLFQSLFALLLSSLLSTLAAQNQGLSISGPNVVCVGDCAIYQAVYSNPNTIAPIGYQWSVSTGGAVDVLADSSQVQICFPASATGTVTITVVALFNNGTVITASYNVVVSFNIPVQISSNNPALCDSVALGQNACEKVCPNTTVTYSINSFSQPGTSGTATWSVNGANNFTVAPDKRSVTVQWGGAGSGSVSVVTFSGQCGGEDAECVTIIEEPEAAFTTSPIPDVSDTVRICKDQTVWFDNQSLYAESWEWYFGDGSAPVATQHPQHVYSTPGVYQVALIARSSCLCADTTYATIEVLDGAAPLLDCVGTVCPGATVTYTTAADCSGFNWSVSANGNILNGGGPNDNQITVQWLSGPNGAIILEAQPCATDACPQPATTRVPIVDDNAEIRGPEKVCPGAESVYAIEPFAGTSFQWAVSGGGFIQSGQGTNSIVVKWSDFPSPNTTRWVTVQYDYCYLGCSGQDSLGVTILSPFVANGPVELCENLSGNFTATLSFGNLPVDCNWELVAPDGTTGWTGSGTTANPLLANGPGIYRIFATPVNPNQSCTNTADWAVTVPATPSGPAGISGNTAFCPGDPVTYSATGMPPNANIRWTIQNGPGAPEIRFGNPVVINWNSTGPWQLTAEQISGDGLNCASAALSIQPQPVDPSLPIITGPDSACINSAVAFQASALDGLLLEWRIPGGGGAIASGQGTAQAGIFWNVAGLHQVEVLVCGQVLSRPVTVLPQPNPIVTHQTAICPGQTALAGSAGPYAAWAWYQDGGNLLSGAPTANLGPGNYYLEVTDNFGCSGNSSFTINTSPQPNLSLTTTSPTGFCNNSLTVTLQALAGNGGALTYEWFRDGMPLGASGPTYSTNQYGSYTVVATNPDGCTAMAGPLVLFQDCGGGGGGGFPGGGPPPCPAGTIDFTVTPTARCDSFGMAIIPNPNYAAGTAEWYFGISGGLLLGTATGDQAGFRFPNAGAYIILLRAQLTSGSVCTAVDSVLVEAAAKFDTLPACAGSGTSFTDISAYLPGSAITGWSWNFGDPASGGANSASTPDPDHVYASGGIYPVTLTVTALSGCTSSTTLDVAVPDGTPVGFNLPAATCSGTSLEFAALPVTGILTLDWDFGDPASGNANTAGGALVYHSFLPGSYTIALTSTNVRGCLATTTQVLTIVANNLSGAIDPNNPAPLCEGQSLLLTAPAGGSSYLWSDSTTTTPTLSVGTEGVYGVTLTDAFGCTYAPPPVVVGILPGPDALIKALLKNDLGQTIGTSYPTLGVCAGEDVYLVAQGSGNYSYSWSAGGLDDELFFTIDRNNLLPVGTHVYTVTVTDGITGCTSVSEPFVVTVHPKPDSFFITQSNFPPCAGSPNILTYNGAQPPNWQLTWNTGVSGPSLTTEEPGQYFIRVSNEFGCVTESNRLTILPGPLVAAIPAGCHTRCNPDTICLPNIPGIVSWQWYHNGNPVPGATSPNFTAQQSGTYWAQLTDVSGCTAQSDPLSLNLLDGFGAILGQVWSDVNNNGLIDAADTLVNGIAVNLWQGSLPAGSALAGNGLFAFPNIPSASYTVALDTVLLPPGWSAVIGEEPALLSGCDVQTEVGLLIRFVCQAAAATVQLAACPGDSALYNGTMIPAGQSQDFLLSTPEGCDSLVTVNVAALTISSGTLDVSACAGNTYDYNGTPIPAGQSQTFTLSNYLGCDSLLTVNVTTLPPSAGTLDVGACAGSTYDYNGTPIPAGQSQTFILSNYLGCDSILTVNVATLPPSTGTLNVGACAGSTYDYNGTPIPAGQSQTFVLSNSIGCDSVLTVNVATLPASTGTLDAVACAGSTYDYNGTPIPAGQSQTFVLNNYLGCDSVLTVNVAAAPVYDDTLRVTICPGTDYLFNGIILLPGDTRSFTFVTQEGCDSTLTIAVDAFPALSFSLDSDVSCPNTPTGSLEAGGLTGGAPPFTYALDGQTFQTQPLFDQLPAGVYTLTILDGNGCRFTRNTIIPATQALVVELADAILACAEPEVTLQPLLGGDTSALQFLWSNGARTPRINATEAGQVWIEVSNQCETLRREATVRWAEFPDNSLVYVPNVFAPGAIGPENHHFRPYFADGVTILRYELMVFDRWGNQLFHSDDPSEAWPGPFRTEDMQPAVFVWHLDAEIDYCGRNQQLKRQGDVTIVR